MRRLAVELAAEFFGDGEEVVREWHDQRWRPQFGGLGINASALVPPELCKQVSWSGSARHVQRIAAAEREEVSWYLEEHREVVLFQNLGNHLDWMAAHATSKILRSEFEKKNSVLKGRPAEQLGAVLGSFIKC